MNHINLDITLVLEGPVLTGATAPGIYGVDALTARNLQNLPILARSLVKGRLRQSWEELNSATEGQPGGQFVPNLEELLGRRAHTTGSGIETAESSVDPYRARLHFTDFVCQKATCEGYRHRIQIDNRRGAAAEGSLLMAESPFGSGEVVYFVGNVDFWVNSTNESIAITRQIECGFLWTTHFGAERTVGFGRVLNVKVNERHTTVTSADPKPFITADCVDMIIRPLAPFCFAGHRQVANLFESEVVIPGAGLKGALVETWAAQVGARPGLSVPQLKEYKSEYRVLAENFDRIIFTHAFPGVAQRRVRPVYAPLSIVKISANGADQWFDLARIGEPCLICGEAPEFRIDWKETRDVDAAFGWPKIRRELRVRTAIDRNLRKAKENDLFAYEMIVPDGNEWFGRIDLREIEHEDDRRSVAAHIRNLLSRGLRGLGKTKVQADVSVLPAGAVTNTFPSGIQPRDGYWIMTIQTPAIMCDPRKLSGPDRDTNLRLQYVAFWHEISGGSLRLRHFYARQRLAGGFYLWKRFQADRPYNPYLLTEEGSVFVLEPTSPDLAEAAQKCVERWFYGGLRLPGWARELYPSDNKPVANPDDDGLLWRSCPYIRQNGYGEIAVNLESHWTSRPPEEKMEVLDAL